MASTNTRWFVVASPTGSTQNQFFDISASSEAANSGSNFINLNAIVGNSATPVVNWGTAGTFPTNSVYSPGIYIRDLYNDPYTSSFYSYLDDNTDVLEISIQQDLQKIFFPGIATGSSAYGFGGKVLITGSIADESSLPIGSNLAGSIGFVGTVNPVTLANTVSMSLAPVSFNGVNFAGFLTSSVDTDYQLIYRDFGSNSQAVYNVAGPFTTLLDPTFGTFRGYKAQVTYVSGTGTLTVSNSGSITFIDTVGNQQTFYIVGVANPRGDKPFANQFTVGTDGVNGDYRSGLIKVYATESNNTADWNSLIKSISGDPSSVYTDPTSVAANHNLFMFTASAGNPGTASWELLANLA
jgi:hypothetical protein